MYGENTNYIPMNIFAGPPSNAPEAKSKALLQAQRDYLGEVNTNKIMQDVMKLAASGSLPDFSKLERKWKE
jgi:hypothetical protein